MALGLRAGLPPSPEEEQQELPLGANLASALQIHVGKRPFARAPAGLLASRDPSLSPRPGGFRGRRSPLEKAQADGP